MHILHDNTLTQDNRDKFVYVAGHYGQLVKFYNVEKLCADKLAEMIRLVPQIKTSRVSVGAFFRLLIPQLISADIDKCIYLDSDMLVNLDIAELWRVNLADKPLAAVREMEANAFNYKTADAAKKYLLNAKIVAYESYFNSGVLLMNLKFLRGNEENLFNGVKWRGEHMQCNCFDQDIFNYLFAKDYVALPVKFDRFICNERSQGQTQIQRAIYHCSSDSLALDTKDPFNRLWMKYFLKTPWFDADTIGRLFASMRQMTVEAKASMIQLSAIMSGKVRAFVVIADNLEATRQIFAVRPDEKIISVESSESLPKVIDAMKRSRGKKIFFVLVPGFPLKILTEAGFVYGADFLNGFEFLSEAHGLPPINSYPLVKAM